MHIADRSARAQPEKDDFVAEGMRGERDRGPRNGELIPLVVEVVPPRLGVIAAGLCERSDDIAQCTRTRRLTAGRARPSLARFVAVGCRHARQRYDRLRGLNRAFVHAVKGRLATFSGTNASSLRHRP